MNRNYQESWYNLIQYLNDADYVYFARGGRIEILINGHSLLISGQPTLALAVVEAVSVH